MKSLEKKQKKYFHKRNIFLTLELGNFPISLAPQEK